MSKMMFYTQRKRRTEQLNVQDPAASHVLVLCVRVCVHACVRALFIKLFALLYPYKD